MSSFTKHPALQPLSDGKHWQVTEYFEFYFTWKGKKYVIRVAKGFISDLASIPRWLWWLIGGPWGKYGYAAIIHDYAYKYKLFPRWLCDIAFLVAMQVLGVMALKRWAMYQAVRRFAWIGWNKHRKKDEILEDTENIVH